MATLFYVLVIAQIALGIYSLWNGFEWFRMVRRRLTLMPVSTRQPRR